MVVGSREPQLSLCRRSPGAGGPWVPSSPSREAPHAGHMASLGVTWVNVGVSWLGTRWSSHGPNASLAAPRRGYRFGQQNPEAPLVHFLQQCDGCEA